MASQVAHMGHQPGRPNHSDTTTSFHSNSGGGMNNHHYHEPHQHTAKMGQITERRMQELRALAYEYVKQIVSKANELSQVTSTIQEELPSHQARSPIAGNASQSSGRGGGGVNRSREKNPRAHNEYKSGSTTGSIQTKRLVDEAAVQINKRFRFLDANPSAAHEPSSLSGQVAADQTTKGPQKSVTYQQHQQRNNPAAIQVNKPARPTQITVHNRPNSAEVTTKTTTTTAGAEIATRGDYIEQDYATMSSSQDENDSSRGTAAAAGRTDNQTTGGRSRSATGSKRAGRFHQCLNWHVLVSCFSTCLPEALTRHTRANMGGPSAV